MKIYRLQTEIYDMRPEDVSNQRVVHMGENVLNLTFRSTNHLDLRINDYVYFENTTYKFKNLSNPTRRSRHEYEYICQLFSPQYDLQDVLFILEDETGVGVLDESIPIFGNAEKQLRTIIKCVQKVYPEWSVGNIEQTSEEKKITYEELDCLAALQHFADQFKIEYWITGTSVSIGKKKYGTPITFKYGKGNAFYELSRQAQEGRIVTALHVSGSDRNIDSFVYGSKYLMMPNKERFIFQNVDKYGTIQGRIKFPVYPRLIHKVPTDPGRVCSVREEKGIWFIKDDNIHFDIELLSGQTLAVDFQTGQLSGLKIDATWHPKTKEFELIKGDYALNTEIPAEIFVPAEGDLYLLSNLKMPKEFIDRAEQELYEAGLKAIKQMCEPKVSYKGPVNPLFFRTLGESIETGRAVIVEDPDIVDGAGSVESRIQAYTQSVNDDLSLDIEISDTLYVSRIDRIENTIKEVKDNTEQKINYGDAYTRRRFRDAKETIMLLEGAQLNFSQSINPVSIQTMQMLIGDISLQFRFVNSKVNPIEISDTMRYNDNTRVFSSQSGVIQHMTLGIDSLAPSHKYTEYKFWDISAFNELIPDSESRYIYLKCNKTSTTGNFVLSKASIAFESVSGHYHFLVGILNSEFEGVRSFVPLYGFSEFTPGQMRVNKMINTDGTQFWDMLNKRFRIGDANSYLSYNVDQPNQLILKGVMVQSPSGETSPIETDRGDWIPTTYYPGDVVKWNGNVYKCVWQTISSINPSYTSYWVLKVSKGDNGTPGTPGIGYEYIWYPSNYTQPPYPPTSIQQDNNVPYGWIAEARLGTWSYLYISNRKKTNGVWSAWSNPTLFTQKPIQGEDGIPGALPTTRLWKEGEYYYRDNSTIDYIMYQPSEYAIPVWYRLREGYVKSAAGKTPAYPFEAISSYEAIATNVLLANEANLAKFIFKDGQLVSQDSTNGVRNIVLNGKTGFAQFGAGNLKISPSGNIEMVGKLESSLLGNRIVIDPNDSSIKMYSSSNKLVASISFYDYLGNVGGRIHLFEHNSSGLVLGKTIITGMGIKFFGSLDSNNPKLSITTGGSSYTDFVFDINDLPSSVHWSMQKGALYRDGNTLKIKTT